MAPVPNELALSRTGGGTDASGAAVPADDIDDADRFRRSAVVLGPGDRLDPEALRRSYGAGHPHLLMLSVGFPPTWQQQMGIDAGMRFATERGICFEARLAWDMDEALDALSPADDILRCLADRIPVA
jgi:hypothetical protein